MLGSARVAVAMQAREGAQVAVVPAGVQLVVVAAGVLLLVVAAGVLLLVVAAGVLLPVVAGAALVVVVGQRGFLSRGEGERSDSRRMNVILFLLRPLIIKKPTKVFSCHLHVRDREYD